VTVTVTVTVGEMSKPRSAINREQAANLQ